MNIIEKICVFIMLMICSITDVRKKVIYARFCIMFFVMGCFIEVINHDSWGWRILTGMLPAALIYFMSIISGENIGKGDAAVFLGIGSWLGGMRSAEIFLLALLCTVIISVPVMIVKNKSIKTSVPFIPFVTIAFMIINIMEMVV